MHVYSRLLAFCTFLLLGARQQATPIRLRSESLPFVPTQFYIAVVTDQRPERGAFSRLALAPNQAVQPVDLEGGVATAINRFINQSMKQDKALRPIEMRIRQCRISETAAGNRISGQFTYDAAFGLMGKNDNGDNIFTQLTEYRGSANYVRPLGQLSVIEPTVRQIVAASLRSLNDYMNRESGRNEKLATSLKVNFMEDTRITNDDTVHYNPARKLIWSDFQADPRRGSHYAAEVFTSFGYEGRSSVKGGVINLNLTVKAYMLKNSSWGRPESKNDYTLNHEQRHFDITKIIVERFKRKIDPDSLTLEDYNSIAQYKFIESFREMNRLQEQYDSETNHGINQAAQERWNQQLDAELRRFGVKK